MITLQQLPALNATLNGITFCLLIVGFIFIKNKKITGHRTCMGLAIVCSVVFLCSYLTYHWHAGMTKFLGVGWIRPTYFTILISHTILAVVILPLVSITVFRAVKKQFEKHKRIARWTFPIWLYVSITGVIIYLILYHWPPLHT